MSNVYYYSFWQLGGAIALLNRPLLKESSSSFTTLNGIVEKIKKTLEKSLLQIEFVILYT
ncbi:hypothetical protein DSM107010_02850 [Chroococcidiopsis cubana SAG 39.79]|uniref:Uncharacterized protein n=1 Tax=Chroococcidiopsis cubana SAG 39.79 TaxID=388085 RepID=A0AB37US76_9CYAN|nr:hypothetical protein DSM107010_02850 [Chroococcidiopsis cubana SAG 39.79]